MSGRPLVQLNWGPWLDPEDVVLVGIESLGGPGTHVFVMLRQTESGGTHPRQIRLWSPEVETQESAELLRDQLARQINFARGGRDE